MSAQPAKPLACVSVAADPAGPPTVTETLTEIILLAGEARMAYATPGDEGIYRARLATIHQAVVRLVHRHNTEAIRATNGQGFATVAALRQMEGRAAA